MISSDKVKAYAMLGGLAVAGFLAWKAYKGAGAVGDSISAGLDSLASMPGRAFNAVIEAVPKLPPEFNYAQDPPPVDHATAINAAARWDAAIVGKRSMWDSFGNYTDQRYGQPYTATDDERAWAAM